jgi:hypothetical protein
MPPPSGGGGCHSIAFALIQKQRGRNLPAELIDVLKEAIPYPKLLEVWHEEKPGLHISTAIRKRNAARTFMKPEKIEEALRTLGFQDVWKLVARKLGRRKDGLRRAFQLYADRRDRIAHEGDLERGTRRRRLQRIRREFVEKALADVEKFVRAVDDAISQKSKR